MQINELPTALKPSRSLEPGPVVKVMMDLTIYFDGPTLEEFEYLLDLYEALCPAERLREFKIDEIPIWSQIEDPLLTIHGRAAAAAGIARPYFEPVRERIQQGRAFEAQYWDGIELDEPEGSWSFKCGRIHLRTQGHFGFARVLLPLDTDCRLLLRLACDMSEHVSFHSGHGGLVFAYDPTFLDEAFDEIYAKARRFWAVDIESIDDTLPLTRRGIKAVNWITLIGHDFIWAPEAARAVDKLADTSQVTTIPRSQGTVFVAGSNPVTGDRNRPSAELAPYFAVANALAPLFLDDHHDFPGERFPTNGNTVGWLRRFVDPDGWS